MLYYYYDNEYTKYTLIRVSNKYNWNTAHPCITVIVYYTAYKIGSDIIVKILIINEIVYNFINKSLRCS